MNVSICSVDFLICVNFSDYLIIMSYSYVKIVPVKWCLICTDPEFLAYKSIFLVLVNSDKKLIKAG